MLHGSLHSAIRDTTGKGRGLSLPEKFMAKKNEIIEPPEEAAFQDKQLDLFRTFLCNNALEQDKLSNTLDLWDSIPRYSVSRQAMNKLRKAGSFLELLTIDFHYRGTPLQAIVQPARIQDKKTGVSQDYYPSANEELVEDALRKIATDQQSGFFDKPNYRSGVVFTLHMLREELKRRGHARSYQQIILSLNILARSSIEILTLDGKEGEGFTVSNYFPGMAAVSKQKLADDPHAKWVVHFHPLVTQAINALTYRQFNYAQMMGYKSQLARWLHKMLSIKYTQASLLTPFEMRYSTIKRDSAMLDGYKNRERDAISALEDALDELTAQKDGVLLSVKKEEMRGLRGKLLDVIYSLTPSPHFVAQMKAANKRRSLSEEAAAGAKEEPSYLAKNSPHRT